MKSTSISPPLGLLLSLSLMAQQSMRHQREIGLISQPIDTNRHHRR